MNNEFVVILKRYILNNAIALDQQFNTLLGGSPDETLSSRAYRTEQHQRILGRIFRPVIDKIFWFEIKHCKKAYYSEINRLQLPSNMLDIYTD